MQLIKLIADKESFHTISFQKGINIIVGKKTNPSNKVDGKTFNGVGKSLIVHLLHFCLCSNKIDPFEEKLPKWTFTLFFSHNGKEHSISRNTSSQGDIYLDGEKKKLKDARNCLLNMIINDDHPLSFQPLLSCVARRYRSSYNRYNQSSNYPDDYSALLNTGFLLGLNTDLIVRKKNLRAEQDNLKKTESLFKKDPIFKEYYCGNSDAQLDKDELEFEIERLKKELSEFKVSNNYHEIEREANEISFSKKKLENDIAVIENNIKNINSALNIQADLSVARVVQMYESATIEISDLLKKTLNEVEEFHQNLIHSRNTRLKSELKRNEDELRKKAEILESLGKKMDQLLTYLNTHGALEEYSALNQQLTDYQLRLNHIQEYQNMLKAFQNKLKEIKNQFILEDKSTDTYLEEAEPSLKALRQKYYEMTKLFYPKKKSGLLIENNTGENQIRFNVEARIEDDSSDGVNEVKIFCFDMLLLLQKMSNFEFLIHDSRLLANMDPRQRTTLYRVAYDICKDFGFQYITTINEDALNSVQAVMDQEEYHEIIENGTILTLKDDSASSKLLGIQVDMDLEK
ncbi:MAG: DUF2326 domain-containing protein [Oscillospiraceae bacterium]|nr:DUF2326 domain-containing protein [Oscillospiraceae bacterium]